jgi:ribulose-phosphate 3-epimerase
MEISPSLLAADPLNLSKDMSAVVKVGAHRFHVDVMDGHFVPNLSFGVETTRAVCADATVPVDVHLMIQPLSPLLDAFLTTQPRSLTIHAEADQEPLLSLEQIRKSGVEAGLALRPSTCWKTIIPFLDLVDHVTIMTVEPGFGGQTLIPEAVQKISYLKNARGDRTYKIHVDGGVGPKNAFQLQKAGADVLVVGTALFRSKNYHATISELTRPKEQLDLPRKPAL